MQRPYPKSGWIEVICGSMFSGKSEELIRRLRRAEIARQRVQIFKPGIDERYENDHIVSHSQMKLRSVAVDTAAELMENVDDRAEVIGVDEAQFFDDGLVDVCQRLANQGKRVIVAGLDRDYMGKPFDVMAQLLATSEYITKSQAICMVCGAPASYSQKLKGTHDRIEIGDAGMYEARCRYCFEPPDEEEAEAKD